MSIVMILSVPVSAHHHHEEAACTAVEHILDECRHDSSHTHGEGECHSCQPAPAAPQSAKSLTAPDIMVSAAIADETTAGTYETPTLTVVTAPEPKQCGGFMSSTPGRAPPEKSERESDIR